MADTQNNKMADATIKDGSPELDALSPAQTTVNARKWRTTNDDTPQHGCPSRRHSIKWRHILGREHTPPRIGAILH